MRGQQKTLAQKVANSVQPAQHEKALGSSKSEWDGSCIKRVVPQFQGSSKSPRTVNQQSLPHACLSIWQWLSGLTFHLAMSKSCKELCQGLNCKQNPPLSPTPNSRNLCYTIGQAKQSTNEAERESAMSEQWRMPPAQGCPFVKRLAALSSPGCLAHNSFFLIVLYCILCYSALIRDWYYHASGGEVVIAVAEDDAGVSFPQQRTATHHHHKERAALSFCSLLRLKPLFNCCIMSH